MTTVVVVPRAAAVSIVSRSSMSRSVKTDSVVIGKLRNRLPHHCRRLLALEDRITPVTRLRRLVSVGLKRGEQIVDGLLGSPLSRTDLHERRVHEDAMQPGVKLRALFERADRSERFDEGFLHGVLRVFVVRQEAASHGEQPAAVDAHDRFIRVGVASLKTRNEHRVALDPGDAFRHERSVCESGHGHSPS